jgi:ABC-type uncharacterized transport system ATPase subunit
MSDVERLGGRVVMLEKGKVKLDETMDDLQERYCIAIVHRPSTEVAGMLARMPDVLRTRVVLDDLHLVAKGSPDDVRNKLESIAGSGNVRCESVPLEEFFIEMAGNDRRKSSLHALKEVAGR